MLSFLGHFSFIFIVSGGILYLIGTTNTIKNIAAASSPALSLGGNPQGENHQWVNPIF